MDEAKGRLDQMAKRHERLQEMLKQARVKHFSKEPRRTSKGYGPIVHGK